MKKIIIPVITSAVLTLASCGFGGAPTSGTSTTSTSTSTSTSSTQSSSQSMLGSLLSTLIGGALPISESSIIGNWTYTSPECRFESENFLMKAGGEIASSQVETKLADVFKMAGIKQGACSFKFSEGNVAAFTIAGKTINGTYSINSSTRKLTFKSTTGLISISATVYHVGNTLTLLFDADKLLSVVKAAGTLLGNNSTVSTLTSLLNSYEGMQLGMNMSRQ